MRALMITGAMSALIASAPVLAETPREILTVAAFQTSNKAKALALVTRAIAVSDSILSTRPDDREATLQRGVGIGYRAKLTRSRVDAKTSLQIFETLATKDPRDPEAQMVIAGWHLDAIDQLGGFMARTLLGAKAQAGDTAMDRAVALGGNRAFFGALGAMMRIRQDVDDIAVARKWAEAAAVAATPTPLDGLMKRNAAAILPALRANDGKAAAAMARRLLPFGRLED